uniref:Uncharacterized protein n=1 Tax=Rhizophora mucronata TaxID=61149 RepID=A0A2P2PDV5_RHIMU
MFAQFVKTELRLLARRPVPNNSIQSV